MLSGSLFAIFKNKRRQNTEDKMIIERLVARGKTAAGWRIFWKSDARAPQNTECPGLLIPLTSRDIIKKAFCRDRRIEQRKVNLIWKLKNKAILS